MFKSYLSAVPFFEDKGYIASEFTFGFEFEGFIDTDNYNEFGSLTNDTWYGRGQIGGGGQVENGRLKDDCSLSTGHEDDGDDHDCPDCGGDGYFRNECEYCGGTGAAFCCLKCDGKGYTKDHCKHCDGTGENLFEKSCSACNGKGHSINNCSECDNTGYVNAERFEKLPKERQQVYIKHWQDHDMIGYRRRHREGDFMPKCPRCDGNGSISVECDYCGGSGHSDREHTDYRTFEFASPAMFVTPANVNDVSKFLKASMKLGTQTNESCGFHIHIGFPDSSTSPYDINWTILQLVAQGKMRTMSEFEGYDFERRWASADRFDSLERDIEDHIRDNIKQCKTKEELYRTIVKSFKAYTWHNKEDMVSQHESGTLEWRGPTGFMDEGSFDKVSRFLKHFYKIVLLISEMSNTQVLDLGDGATIKKYDYLVAMSKGYKDRDIELARSPERKPHMRNVNGKMVEMSTKPRFDQQQEERIRKFNQDYPFMRKVKFTEGLIDRGDYNLAATIANGQSVTFSGEKPFCMKVYGCDEIVFNGDKKNFTIYTNNMFSGCTFNKMIVRDSFVSNGKITDSILNHMHIKYSSTIQTSAITQSIIAGVTIHDSKISNSNIDSTQLINCDVQNSVITLSSLDQVDKIKTSKFEKCEFYGDGVLRGMRNVNSPDEVFKFCEDLKKRVENED